MNFATFHTYQWRERGRFIDHRIEWQTLGRLFTWNYSRFTVISRWGEKKLHASLFSLSLSFFFKCTHECLHRVQVKQKFPRVLVNKEHILSSIVEFFHNTQRSGWERERETNEMSEISLKDVPHPFLILFIEQMVHRNYRRPLMNKLMEWK